MNQSSDDDTPWLEEETIPTLVESGAASLPFMPGILVHDLVSRGVPFRAAYAAAGEIQHRIEGRSQVSKQELATAVGEILGRDPKANDPAASRDIVITGPDDGLPFSKGILSRSLLATAMDPNDAFALAREIERDLISSRVREISRHDLRKLACRVLRRISGDETAERYLLWRSYREPDRPVILLLGGTSGVGKSSLALEVAGRLGIGRVLSTDSIRQMMRIMLSPDLVPAIYGSSYDAYERLPREDRRKPPVIDGFRAQASAVSIGIRASLDRAVSESANLVIDGVSIAPGSFGVEAYAGDATVIFLLVALLDEDALRNRFVVRATVRSGVYHTVISRIWKRSCRSSGICFRWRSDTGFPSSTTCPSTRPCGPSSVT
jgi:2-phosphoglycerate kinase